MEQSEPDPAASEKSMLEARVAEAPHLVVEYIRLARLLEDEGDLKGAAMALQKAYFFLPNSPAILEAIGRLSKWIDTTRSPITVLTRATDAKPYVEPGEESDAEAAEAVAPAESELEDELDQLIAGLGKARLGQAEDVTPPPVVEWSDDDGLLATETLAHIFASQNQFEEAVRVYDRLARKETDPEKAAALRAKAEELRKKLGESG